MGYDNDILQNSSECRKRSPQNNQDCDNHVLNKSTEHNKTQLFNLLARTTVMNIHTFVEIIAPTRFGLH